MYSETESSPQNLQRTFYNPSILNRNRFAGKSTKQLIELLQTIPDNEYSANLSWLRLYEKTDIELTAIFTSISEHVSCLILKRNNLAALGNKLASVLYRVSKGIKLLDLSGNNLDKLDNLIFSTLSPAITHLNLSWNNLNRRTGIELGRFLKNLAPTVTFLSLRRNGFDSKPTSDLVIAFSNLSPKLNSLDLSWNGLDKRNAAELGLIFEAFPNNIVNLNLSKNGLDKLSLEDLKSLANKLSYLTTVYLSKNEVDQPVEYRQAWAKIFPNIQKVILLDSFGKELSVAFPSLNELNFTRSLGGKTVVPSLLSQCIFCIKEKKIKAESFNMPRELYDLIS